MEYEHYFKIDEEYFAQINAEVIKQNPEIWKKYYPHESFIKLVKDTVDVLSRKQRLSIWVEGAYGTGKSHAVLTLKKLLDASAEDVQEYFNNYKDQLNIDLYNKLQRIKNDDKKILTVHRYGSSDIKDDNNLVFALQESIEEALAENGIVNRGSSALKNSVLEWLSKEASRNYFDSLLRTSYQDLFGGDTVNDVIEKLETFSGSALLTLMEKITKVGEREQIRPFTLSIAALENWIKAVIKENDLKAIVFIWDEFTEYFKQNLKALTGFQKIAEISANDPFYMIIVTHKSSGLFSDTDPDQKRILDRFVSPTCNIILPEKEAFRLMGAAMKKTEDTVLLEEWKEIADDLYDRTRDSRVLVKKIGISDEELKNILPIHPYAALLLKYISSVFDSNQRSMFDFIKNDRGDEIKSFLWFIKNHSPEDDNPLLTIDMLWDFFYEKGKEHLSQNVRSILDWYGCAATRNLSNDEQRVLKTVLILEAISQSTNNAERFIPDEKNISSAFDGSDLDIRAKNIAEKLCRDEILYKKPLGGNKFQYSSYRNVGDLAAIEKLKEELYKKTTAALIADGDIAEAITLTDALRLRYVMRFVSAANFNNEIKKLRNESESHAGKIQCVVAFAKDDVESANITKLIDAATKDDSGFENIIFVDASINPIGKDIMEQYAENMANAQYHMKSDRALGEQYAKNAKEVLQKWKKRIVEGEFIVSYTDAKGNKMKERVASVEKLCDVLADINRHIYPCGLETGKSVTVTMWQVNSLKAGVECGATQVTKSSFRSANVNTKLENYLEGAWQQAEGETPYWEAKPYLNISKIKIAVNKVIEEAFEKQGRVSITQIYNVVKEKPFGFMPCNLTAFIMGFILKEYVNGIYSYSDSITSMPLTVDKLKEMVADVISLQVTPKKGYKEKYIVLLTEEEKAFNQASSAIFQIPLDFCTNVEQTRNHIREKMNTFPFPIWCLKYVVDDTQTNVHKLIDYYKEFVNNNGSSGKSDSDIAISIGKLCTQNNALVDNLKAIMNSEKCIEGMKNYIQQFENGELITLADAIGDNGQYINVLQSKFDAKEANWVWNIETAEQKIKEVILEYRIIVESNKINEKAISFSDAIKNWRSKCDFIRLSYPAIKSYVTEIDPLLEMLYTIMKTGNLLDSQKEKFLDYLKTYADGFNHFYQNQFTVFKQLCTDYIEDSSDEEITELYNAVIKVTSTGCFTKEKTDYITLLESKANELKTQRGFAKLRKLWKEKTDTTTPKEWSKNYKMSILYMIKPEDLQQAKTVFNIINRQSADANSIENAISFLEAATFFDNLKRESERDKAFRNYILEDYAVLLNDIEEVKNYLEKTMTSKEPYDWFETTEIRNKIKNLAQNKYSTTGYHTAFETIDSMNSEDVKRYLKDLIQNNMVVGIEIIKGK